MSLPQLTLTDTNNIVLSALDFGVIDAGSQSAGIPVRIWNNYAGAAGVSDAVNPTVTAVTYNSLDSGDSITNGNEIVLNRFVQAQCISAGQTNYTAIGGAAVLSISDGPPGTGSPPPPPTIHAGSFANMLFSINVPPSASPANITFILTFNYQYS